MSKDGVAPAGKALPPVATGRAEPVLPGRRGAADVAFWVLWLASTVAWAWLLSRGQRGFDLGALGIPLLLVLSCTVALILRLPVPDLDVGAASGSRLRLVAACLGVVGLLGIPYALLGKSLIFVFPVAALATIALLRFPVPRMTLAYVLPLALLAGLAGLGAGWVPFPPAVWAPLQVALVLTCLPAGLGIMEREGLLARGAGASVFLTRGAKPAARAVAAGAFLALPWALMNVISGGAGRDAWATAPWAPLVAVQPGIAEEAWGRVFLVALVYLGLRSFGGRRSALTAAVLIAGYWFAYLHTSGGLEAVFSTLLIGTFYSMPISYLWLRRGFETAVGFHVCVDAVRYAAAYLANTSL